MLTNKEMECLRSLAFLSPPMLATLFHVLALILNKNVVAWVGAAKSAVIKVASDPLYQWDSSFDSKKNKYRTWSPHQTTWPTDATTTVAVVELPHGPGDPTAALSSRSFCTASESDIDTTTTIYRNRVRLDPYF
ncbi:hypothetical protein VNO77_31012 [Canavalia gladiata]|uniref:Uncharacterized protein n=1 Tax=Canavalia gladiata TaxID=3824 RepID=A0AAN9Q3I9_CANGL